MTNNAPKPPKTIQRRRLPLLRILLALVLITAILNIGVLGAQALIKPVSGTPGSLLYATQFQDPTDSDWYQYQSALSAQITNGAMLLSADEPGFGIFSPLNYPLADFDVRVVTHQLSGDDPFSEYGVLFRYQDAKNFYIFYVESDGAYRVARVLNGDSVDLSARHPLPGLELGPNHTNDLRVVGLGNRFQFYLNGQLLTLCPKGSDKRATWSGDQCISNNHQTTQTLTDDTFSTGKIGVGLLEHDLTAQVAFSNFVVFSPKP